MEYRLKVINGANWETRTLVPRRGDNDGWAERRKGVWMRGKLFRGQTLQSWVVDWLQETRETQVLRMTLRFWVEETTSLRYGLGDGGHSACLASISSLFQQEILSTQTWRVPLPGLVICSTFWGEMSFSVRRHLNWSVEAQTHHVRRLGPLKVTDQGLIL